VVTGRAGMRKLRMGGDAYVASAWRGQPVVSADVTLDDGSAIFASSRRDQERLCLMDVRQPTLRPPNPWLSFHPDDYTATRPLFSPKSAEAATAGLRRAAPAPASEWERCVDPASNTPFWVNHAKKTISLVPPPGHEAQALSTCSAGAGEAEPGHSVKISPSSHGVCSPFLSVWSSREMKLSSAKGTPSKRNEAVEWSTRATPPPPACSAENGADRGRVPAARNVAEDLSRAATRASSKSPGRNPTCAAGDGGSSTACSLEAADETRREGGGRCGDGCSARKHEAGHSAVVQPAGGHIETTMKAHRHVGAAAPEAGSERSPSPAASSICPDTVKVYIRDAHTRESFRVKTTVPLSRVFNKYCGKKGIIDVAECTFTYNSTRLSGGQSLETLGLKSQGTITIWCSPANLHSPPSDGIKELQALSEDDEECGAAESKESAILESARYASAEQDEGITPGDGVPGLQE